jgi:hypothetical protein
MLGLEDMVEQYHFVFSALYTVSGGVGRFVPLVMAVERGVLQMLGLFKILHFIVHQVKVIVNTCGS